jgi:hypothetical protein
MRVLIVISALLIASGVAAQPAYRSYDRPPRDIGISGSSHDERVSCRGEEIHVSGSSNRVGAVGACSGVHVSGSSNEISVDLLPGSPIDLSGSSNTVIYRIVERGPDAVIHQSGSNNIVRRR